MVSVIAKYSDSKKQEWKQDGFKKGVGKDEDNRIKKGFQDGKYEELLRDIYIDESVLDYQKERYIKAIESFEELFGEKEVEIYSAPGRSEIGGNHTDHQLGRVLAASINLDAIAIVAKKRMVLF